LRGIAANCDANDVLCCDVLFPILHRLDDRYPFRGIHESLQQEIESTGALFVDLLPELVGKDESELWVHPTDHHPNEIVHKIAARKLAEALIRFDAFDLEATTE
jgi:hypothetical protein